jgi:hypothetical protein
VGKSNKQKAMAQMDMTGIGKGTNAVPAPKSNHAEITIRAEKKMVDGGETITATIQDHSWGEGMTEPLKKEFSTAEALKAAVGVEIDKLYKKVK